MAEETVPVTKFKAACLALLDKVKSTGQPILVTRQGKPIARISPPPRPDKPEPWLGSFKSKGRIVGDIVSPASNEKDWEAIPSTVEASRCQVGGRRRMILSDELSCNEL
jgi:prevent-host-death family protein